VQSTTESGTSLARREIEKIDVALVWTILAQVHLDLTDDGIPDPRVDVTSWMARDAISKPLEVGFPSTEAVFRAEATDVGIAPKLDSRVGIARKLNRAENRRW
jgi:hypothetical protein